jgi:phage head maturation protease
MYELVQRGDLQRLLIRIHTGERQLVQGTRCGRIVASHTTLEDVDLLDVSIVGSPAYKGTEVNSLQEVERQLTAAYFPNGLPSEIRSHV